MCLSVCKSTVFFAIYIKYILYNFIIIVVTSEINQYASLPQDRLRRKATVRNILWLLMAFKHEHLEKTEKSYWKSNEQLQ